MNAQPRVWTPDRRDEFLAALRASKDRRAAAERLGVTMRSLDAGGLAYRVKLCDYLDRNAGRDPEPALVAVAPPPPAPEWPPPGYAPKHAKPSRAAKAEVVRTIVISDAHRRYVSQPAWSCALGIIRDVKPQRVVLNGDIMEVESLSRHPKSRPDLARLSEEYYDANVGLDEVQNAAPSSDIYYVEGNHENRVTRFAAEYGELDGMLSVPVSLYITPKADYHRETVQLRGIHWVPLSMQPFTVGAAAYLHGVFESLYHAAMTAQHLGPKCGSRVLITGHMHGWQSFASPSGFVAYACPWLGDETAHVFRAYVKGRPRPWHLGVLHVEECGEDVTVTPIFIRNGRALFGGRIIAREAA